MKMPEFDGRKLPDIKDLILGLSGDYTPEWRFDEDKPDLGTALALVYADMFADSFNGLSMVPEKSMVAFFREINSGLLPAIPAAGYVAFTLTGDQRDGVAAKSKTRLIADVEKSSVVFETAQDVFVTPARLERMFCVSGRHDIITRVFDLCECDNGKPFCLFDLNEKNLQEHILYIGQANALNVRSSAWIEVELFSHYENRIDDEILLKLLDVANASWEYCSDLGYLPFDEAK
ncbi:MAG: hypothetical protein FWD21_05215, partial [Peptococcaceae bacterium]|nr:hypothetical protein [Peptococcaceae bacterium]